MSRRTSRIVMAVALIGIIVLVAIVTFAGGH
jgi:hypothetical protein